MKKRKTFQNTISSFGLIIFVTVIHPSESFAQKIELSGGEYPAIVITPSKETGLNQLYVAYDITNLTLIYTTNNPGDVKVSVFSNKGANFATPVDNINIDNNNVKVDRLTSDSGYIIEDGEITQYIWIVDYASHRYNIDAISPSPDTSCESTILDVSGQASPIYYYTINGRQETLSRDIMLTYNSLEFDEDSRQFVEKEFKKNIAYINDKITIIPPILCSTSFILEGDRFLEKWKQNKVMESEIIAPIATMVMTEAIQENNTDDSLDTSNQITSNIDGLGGSAPVEISFQAYVSDAVIHYEWQMANDAEFEDVTYRINQQDLDYTFTTEGTTYVRFIGSNSDGSCESYGDTYTVSIGASELLVPNAFSPNGDGINDEWKVSYRSLIDFKCWIFDRQGHEIFMFDNPAMGWNGKSKGKNVKPGVYFYVIQATGSDGKKYKKSGDINILKSSGNNSSSRVE